MSVSLTVTLRKSQADNAKENPQNFHLDWLGIWDFGMLEFLAKLKLPWNGTYWNPIAVNCTWMSDLCFELGNALRETVPCSNDYFSIITYNYHQCWANTNPLNGFPSLFFTYIHGIHLDWNSISLHFHQGTSCTSDCSPIVASAHVLGTLLGFQTIAWHFQT